MSSAACMSTSPAGAIPRESDYGLQSKPINRECCDARGRGRGARDNAVGLLGAAQAPQAQGQVPQGAPLAMTRQAAELVTEIVVPSAFALAGALTAVRVLRPTTTAGLVASGLIGATAQRIAVVWVRPLVHAALGV